jgi:hypothetical protein
MTEAIVAELARLVGGPAVEARARHRELWPVFISSGRHDWLAMQGLRLRLRLLVFAAQLAHFLD